MRITAFRPLRCEDCKHFHTLSLRFLEQQLCTLSRTAEHESDFNPLLCLKNCPFGTSLMARSAIVSMSRPLERMIVARNDTAIQQTVGLIS